MITTSKSAKIIPHIVLIILTLVCLLPLLLLLMASLTDEQTLMLNGYSFFPKKFSADAYTYIFKTGKTVLRAYGITFFVTAVGTVFALLIPSFLMSPFNVILMRNYFKTNIPDAIIEAAKLDGASELRTLVNVVLPMSTPIIGTIGLMSGLAYWNDWTNGLYYLVKRTDLDSIQNVLTNMLNNIQFLKTATQLQGINIEMGTLPSVSIRMAIAVVAVIPVMIVYPFIQKSFVKGIVIGGVKG